MDLPKDLPKLLQETADKIRLIDERINRFSALVDYSGTLRIYAGKTGMEASWEGSSESICKAVSQHVAGEINDLCQQKLELYKKIVNEIDAEYN